MGRSSGRKKSAQAARRTPAAGAGSRATVPPSPEAASDPPLLATGVVPRSVEVLGDAQVEAVRSIQRVELERRGLQRQLDELVLRGRTAGISWAALGWALGISGQAAQQRYGKRS